MSETLVIVERFSGTEQHEVEPGEELELDTDGPAHVRTLAG